MTMPAPPSAAARSSRRSMGAISWFITEGKSAACTGGIGGSKASAGAGVESYCASASGQAMPASPCSAASVMPNALATAATFARNNVPERTGRGPSTRTSRRSGNVDSQHSTANRPTTSMVVAIRKCSAVQAPAICISGDSAPPRTLAAHNPAPAARMMPRNISSEANWPSSVRLSPSACAESSSRSTIRKSNSRYRTRKWSFFTASPHARTARPTAPRRLQERDRSRNRPKRAIPVSRRSWPAFPKLAAGHVRASRSTRRRTIRGRSAMRCRCAPDR